MPEFFHFNAVKRKIVYEDVEREIVRWLFKWISRDRTLTMAPLTSQLYLWCGILIAFLTVIQKCHTGIWTFLINDKFMSHLMRSTLLPQLTDITSQHKRLPSFQRVECSEKDIAELCIDVIFVDGSHDMLLVSPRSVDAPTVMKGTLKSNRGTKVVVILGDEFNPRTTVSNEDIHSGNWIFLSSWNSHDIGYQLYNEPI